MYMPVCLCMLKCICFLITGDEHSLVAAHMTKSGVLSATISTATDTYHIEPSDRYLSYPHAFQMIVYRGSDVINPPIQFADDMIVNQRSGSAFHRNKVSAQSKDIKSGDVCKMILVGDHTFYKQMGSDCEKAATYLVCSEYLTMIVSVTNNMHNHA